MKSNFKKQKIRLKGKKLSTLIKAVLERDGHTCQDKNRETCPGTYPLDSPHHIIFKSQGGEDTMENLVTLCGHCHGLRHGLNIVR